MSHNGSHLVIGQGWVNAAEVVIDLKNGVASFFGRENEGWEGLKRCPGLILILLLCLYHVHRKVDAANVRGIVAEDVIEEISGFIRE